jgi:hypothetical protein
LDDSDLDALNVKTVTRRLLAFAMTLATMSGAAAQGKPVEVFADGTFNAAEVTLTEGDTMLIRGGSFSTPVRRDVPIRSGDRIRTGRDGRVQLRFADGAQMSIQGGSEFRVDAYVFDQDRQRSFFELIKGSIRVVSGRIGKRDPQDWRLTTPTATIGIRGTEFTVDQTVCPASGCTEGLVAGLKVAVIAGRVAVTNLAGTVEVPAGASLSLADVQTRPSPVPSQPAVTPVRPSGRARAADSSVTTPSAGPAPAASGNNIEPIEPGRFGER